jgi:beta-lactamase regulating signal transducer with metallopeptidase domain
MAAALLVYSAQILAIVCLATLATTLFRLSLPAARLVYWRVVGGLCLALPLFAVTRVEPLAATTPFVTQLMDGVASAARTPALTATGDLIMWTWAIGAAACLARLLLGVLRLRQIRDRSTSTALGGELETLRVTLAPHAEVRWSQDVGPPVTFGARRPVILIPPQFAALSPEAQRAVACHELLHVARRDWLWTLFEEAVRALFWFHPAVWWVLRRIHLSREQVIDQLVVARMPSRKPYMQALMAFAEEQPLMSPSVSMAFLQRRDLAARVAQLSKESHMSWKHLTWTTLALLVAMGGATTAVVSALPFHVAAVGPQGSPTRLEFRLAETAPANGLVEISKRGEDEHLYLHLAPVATGADVESVQFIEETDEPLSIEVIFGAEGSSRMAAATSGHLDRPLAILLDGRVVTALTVRGVIRDRTMITGDFTRAEADALASALAIDRQESEPLR